MTSDFFEFLLKRFVGFLGVSLVLAAIVFMLARIIPGDPARIALGPTASAEQVTALQHEMGLDQPLYVQFTDFITKAVQGDFGVSFISNKPALPSLLEVLPATLELVFVSLALILLFGLPLGVLSARYHNRVIDGMLRIFSLIGVTLPGFLLAILLQSLAAHFLADWPILGRTSREFSNLGGPTGMMVLDGILTGNLAMTWSALQHLLLPAFALSVSGIGQVTRITRNAVIGNMHRDHVHTLRCFGVPMRVISFRYLLKLSSVAPLTVMGLEFASLVSNSFVVEMVFSWGGFSSAGLEAIMQKDLNTVMALTMISGAFFVLANLLVDVVIGIINPRLWIREER